MLPKIQYIKGDATTPCLKQGANNYILHVCNDVAKWGAGFVLALNKTFGNRPKLRYLNLLQKLKDEGTNPLGRFSIVDVSPESENNTILYVVNMIAQRDVKPMSIEDSVLPLIRYESLVKCMERIERQIAPESAIHFPLFGAGIGGGDWNTIQYLIRAIFHKYDCFGYVFPTDTQFYYLLEE